MSLPGDVDFGYLQSAIRWDCCRHQINGHGIHIKPAAVTRHDRDDII